MTIMLPSSARRMSLGRSIPLKVKKKTMKIDIKPHEGINDIVFGLDSKAVSLKLGAPESTKEKSTFQFNDISIPEPKTDYYFNNSLQISYDENDNVEFIEIASKESNLEISIYGFRLNEVSAEEIISFLAKEKKLKYDENGEEFPYTYNFVDIDLTFWRQVLPENEKDEDGKYFDTVGIGKTGYLKK